MKIVLLTTLFGIILLNEAKSQNYQCLYSKDTNYYQSQDGYILATRVDSVTIMGGDSLFHSFETKREVGNSSDPYDAQAYVGKNWFGTNVLIKSNGENVFYNKDDEEIVFKTNAVLKDTFLLYSNSSKDSIKGWISKHDTMTILGVKDSVKYISIFGNRSFRTVVDQFILSKHHGLIELFPFYSFPNGYETVKSLEFDVQRNIVDALLLVGTEKENRGITMSTNHEINEVEVGDEFHVFSTYTANGYAYREKNKRWLIKNIQEVSQFSLDSISVVSKELFQTENFSENLEYDRKERKTFSGEEVTTQYYLVNNDLFLNVLPEEFNFKINSEVNPDNGDSWLDNFWCSMKIDTCGRRAYEIVYEGMKVYSKDSIKYSTDGPSGSTYGRVNVFLDGIGFLPARTKGYDGFLFNESRSDLVYTNTQGSCGERIFLNVSDEFEQKVSPLLVFPNPVSEKLNITGTDLVDEIVVLDLSGKVVLRSSSFSNNEIDVSILEPGSYFLFFDEEGVRHKLKFVKV